MSREKSHYIALDPHSIRALLPSTLNEHLDLQILSRVTSTQDIIKQSSPLPYALMQVCCAEAQTAGRGRFQRQWHSPFGENIYFSLGYLFSGELSMLRGLSLVIGLALLHALHKVGIKQNIQLKWPNDLFWQNQKLGGILIETIAHTHAAPQKQPMWRLVVGIGLNVNTSQIEVDNKPCCSLYTMTQTYWDRNVLIAELIQTLQEYIQTFFVTGLAPFIPEWNTKNYLYHRQVTIQYQEKQIIGSVEGINEQGELQVKDAQGRLHAFSSGEATIKL